MRIFALIIFYAIIVACFVSCETELRNETDIYKHGLEHNKKFKKTMITCETFPEFYASWVVIITDYSQYDGNLDTAFAFAGIESVPNSNLVGYKLEVFASSPQDNLLPVPDSILFMTDKMMPYLDGLTYLGLIENEFQRQYIAKFGAITPAMNGKYVYVKMRLKNQCNEVSDFVTVPIVVNQVPGNVY